MYKPHNPLWLVCTFLALLALFVVANVKQRRKVWNLHPNVVLGIGVLAGLQIVLLLGIRGYDRYRMRTEIKRIVPAEVAKLNLGLGNVTREITDPRSVAELFGLIQSARPVAAHHSTTTERFDLSFEFQGQPYQYQLGRDSERPTEFWLIPVGRPFPGGEDLDVGRIESAPLGALLEQLLKPSSEAKP